MCKFQNDYVRSPKKVGDKLEAGLYAFNDDGTPIRQPILLMGYNTSTGKWVEFTRTTPDPNIGWAGMPMITFSAAHVGNWTMHFETLDGSCNVGPYPMVITSTAMPIQFVANGNGSMLVMVNNKMVGTARQGFPVNTALNIGDVLEMMLIPFSGSKVINLCDVPQTECQTQGYYKFDITGQLPQKMVATFSEAPVIVPIPPETPGSGGGGGGGGTSGGGTGGGLPTTPSGLVSTHAFAIDLQPLAFADLTGITNFLPNITTEFAKAITLYGWTGWTVIESRIEGRRLVIYLNSASTLGLRYTLSNIKGLSSEQRDNIERSIESNNVHGLALPAVAGMTAAAATIATIALRFGFLIIGWAIIDLAGKAVKAYQTQAETEQIRVKTISDLCDSGALTPEQCKDAIEKSREKGLFEGLNLQELGIYAIGGIVIAVVANKAISTAMAPSRG